MKGKEAREYWKRIIPELVKARSITALHLEALEALCREWQNYLDHTEWIENNPDKLVIQFESGFESEALRVRLAQRCFNNLTKLWPKFGLTPDGMQRIGKNVKVPQVNPFEPEKRKLQPR